MYPVLYQAVICAFGVALLGSSSAQTTTSAYIDLFATGTTSTQTVPTRSDSSDSDSLLLPLLHPISNATFEDDPQAEGIVNKYWLSLLDYPSLPDDDGTKAFLLTFATDLQRQIIATQLSYCPLLPLCTHALNDSEDDSYPYVSCCEPCSCDPDCVTYGNCCPDVMTDPQQFFDVDVRESCIWLHLQGGYVNFQNDAATGIAECPRKATYRNSHKCAQVYHHSDVTFTDILPVWHNASNRLYRNIHCALCNGVSSKKLDFFKPEIVCDSHPQNTLQTDAELIKYIFNGDQCDIKFRHPFANVDDLYCLESVSRCNVTGRWAHYDPHYETACQMYTSTIEIDNSIRFRNVFCALCNGYEAPARLCNSYSDAPPSSPYSFSGLLAISPPDGDTDKSAGRKQCEPGYIYHHSMDQCVKARCSFQRFLVGSECVDMVTESNGFKYSAVFRIAHTTPYAVADVFGFAGRVAEVVVLFKEALALAIRIDFNSISICGIEMHMKTNASCEQKNTPELYQSDFEHVLVNVNISINVKHRREIVVEALKSTMRTYITEHETMMVNLVSKHELDVGQRRQFDSFCSSVDDTVWMPLYPPRYLIDDCNLSPYDSHDYIPVTSLLSCPMINISHDANPWIIDDEEVSFTQSGQTFNNSQFYLSDNGNIFLCKDQYFELYTNTVTREWSLSIEHIVSLVCSSLSIVSLLITLIAFSVLAKLRTLPGKNNMALVSALLFAQLMYLVGSFSRLEQGSLACKIVGIFTHFSWLLVVFWMNVCTFHMFRVLTKTKMISRGAGNKKHLLYHVYCGIAAAIFVGINVLVSSVTSGYRDIGYGVNSCYVSSQEMLVYTFGIPLAVVVVSNLGMFIVVIVTIKKSSAVHKNVQNERNDIAVFARLSTLTGATWIFGFFYMWTRAPALSYIFIVLNASQGVFLFVSFICTRRVVKMAEQRFSTTSRTQTSSFSQTRSTEVGK